MSLVRLRVSSLSALRDILRLPGDVTLAGAGTERLTTAPGGADVLVLVLDMPDAPDGASEVVPFYARDTGQPDPITLTGFQWFRADGSEIKQEPAAGSR